MLALLVGIATIFGLFAAVLALTFISGLISNRINKTQFVSVGDTIMDGILGIAVVLAAMLVLFVCYRLGMQILIRRT